MKLPRGMKRIQISDMESEEVGSFIQLSKFELETQENSLYVTIWFLSMFASFMFNYVYSTFFQEFLVSPNLTVFLTFLNHSIA